MTNITTRAGKAAPLTFDEMDLNFVNLNRNKVEESAFAKMLEQMVVRNDLSSAVGAGMVGCSQLGPGAAIRDLLGKVREVVHAADFSILANGTDETAKVLDLVANLRNTGRHAYLDSGVIRVTQPFEVEGFHLHIGAGAAIEVYGSDQAAFVNGGVWVKAGGKLTGGTIYTSGPMTAVFSGAFATRPCALFCDGGEVDGVTVYSQIFAAVKYKAGRARVNTYGGVYRGVEAGLFSDLPVDLSVNYYNAGVAYVNRAATNTVDITGFACLVRAYATINQRVKLHVTGDYAAKNGLWVEAADQLSHTINHLSITGDIANSGYYRNAAGAEVIGSGAGTNIEILCCPDSTIDINTRRCQGYNVAIAKFSHRAILSGTHVGSGGDPVVVVVDSDDVHVGGNLSRGTVGVSIGEDGATANHCHVSAHIWDCTASPVRFSAGVGLYMKNAVIHGEPTLTSVTGSWAGAGEVKPLVQVLESANDVVIAGCSVQGWFTHDVVDTVGAQRLRVTRFGNALVAPIMCRDDISLHMAHRTSDSARFVRILNDADTTGHAGVGEITIPASSPIFSSYAINPAMANIAALAAVGEPLDDVLNRYAVLMYVKYVSAMNGNRVAFSLDSTGGVAHVGSNFFSPFTTTPNSIEGKLHPLVAGEFVPVVVPLRELIYTGANKAALSHFQVWKIVNGESYNLTMTKPVLIYIGTSMKVP